MKRIAAVVFCTILLLLTTATGASYASQWETLLNKTGTQSIGQFIKSSKEKINSAHDFIRYRTFKRLKVKELTPVSYDEWEERIKEEIEKLEREKIIDSNTSTLEKRAVASTSLERKGIIPFGNDLPAVDSISEIEGKLFPVYVLLPLYTPPPQIDPTEKNSKVLVDMDENGNIAAFKLGEMKPSRWNYKDRKLVINDAGEAVLTIRTKSGKEVSLMGRTVDLAQEFETPPEWVFRTDRPVIIGEPFQNEKGKSFILTMYTSKGRDGSITQKVGMMEVDRDGLARPDHFIGYTVPFLTAKVTNSDGTLVMEVQTERGNIVQEISTLSFKHMIRIMESFIKNLEQLTSFEHSHLTFEEMLQKAWNTTMVPSPFNSSSSRILHLTFVAEIKEYMGDTWIDFIDINNNEYEKENIRNANWWKSKLRTGAFKVIERDEMTGRYRLYMFHKDRDPVIVETNVRPSGIDDNMFRSYDPARSEKKILERSKRFYSSSMEKSRNFEHIRVEKDFIRKK